MRNKIKLILRNHNCETSPSFLSLYMGNSDRTKVSSSSVCIGFGHQYLLFIFSANARFFLVIFFSCDTILCFWWIDFFFQGESEAGGWWGLDIDTASIVTSGLFNLRGSSWHSSRRISLHCNQVRSNRGAIQRHRACWVASLEVLLPLEFPSWVYHIVEMFSFFFFVFLFCYYYWPWLHWAQIGAISVLSLPHCIYSEFLFWVSRCVARLEVVFFAVWVSVWSFSLCWVCDQDDYYI